MSADVVAALLKNHRVFLRFIEHGCRVFRARDALKNRVTDPARRVVSVLPELHVRKHDPLTEV